MITRTRDVIDRTWNAITPGRAMIARTSDGIAPVSRGTFRQIGISAVSLDVGIRSDRSYRDSRGIVRNQKGRSGLIPLTPIEFFQVASPARIELTSTV